MEPNLVCENEARLGFLQYLMFSWADQMMRSANSADIHFSDEFGSWRWALDGTKSAAKHKIWFPPMSHFQLFQMRHCGHFRGSNHTTTRVKPHIISSLSKEWVPRIWEKVFRLDWSSSEHFRIHNGQDMCEVSDWGIGLNLWSPNQCRRYFPSW